MDYRRLARQLIGQVRSLRESLDRAGEYAERQAATARRRREADEEYERDQRALADAHRTRREDALRDLERAQRSGDDRRARKALDTLKVYCD